MILKIFTSRLVTIRRAASFELHDVRSSVRRASSGLGEVILVAVADRTAIGSAQGLVGRLD